MVVHCGRCNLGVEEQASAYCGGCGSDYHYDCSIPEAAYRKMSSAKRKAWLCSSCVNKPVSGSKCDCSNQKELNEIKATLNGIARKLTSLDSMQKDILEIKKANDFISKQYDDLYKVIEKNNALLSDLKKETTELKLANAEKDKTVSDLTNRLNKLEQYSRSNLLEVSNVTENESESCTETVLYYIKKAGIEMEAEDIHIAHRIPTKSNRPNPIIVSFASRSKREEVLSKRRVVHSEQMDGTGNQGVVYFNESLSPFYRALFRDVRIWAKEKKVQFVWFRRNRILLRKTTGAPVFVIESQFDFDSCKQKLLN